MLLCLLFACFVAVGCTESAPSGVDEQPASAAGGSNLTVTVATPEAAPAGSQRDARPPTMEEARAALERVYKQALAVEEYRPDAILVGDFNGDGSADLAVAAKAAPGGLDLLNSEFPNWIVADPGNALPFDPNRPAQPAPPDSGPPKIERRDALLAIVHGHGPEGWRSPEATQSYLLKGGAGAELRALPVKDYPPALKVRRSLNPRADIISGRFAGADSFLYWSRGKYIRHRR